MDALSERTPSRRDRERELQVAIGQRMRWARQLVEPNQAAFARLIGVLPPIINKVEMGVQGASAMIVREYATRLRVTTDYILFGRLQSEPMDYEMQMRLVSEHPELFGLQRTGSSRPGTDH